MAKAEVDAPTHLVRDVPASPDPSTEFDAPLAEAMKTDAAWSPMKLTGVGLVTLLIALSIIVFIATRLTTCMYLDGSSN